MFALFFYILLGLVCPTQSTTPSNGNCQTETTYNTADDGGPGGEIGDNPPQP